MSDLLEGLSRFYFQNGRDRAGVRLRSHGGGMSLEFSQRAGKACIRCALSGNLGSPHVQEAARELFRYCKQNGVKKVLFDSSATTGDLSLLDRYPLGKAATSHIGCEHKVAFFGTERPVQPDRFFAKVAQQKGTNVWGFNNV